MSASRLVLPARLAWPHWLGALLLGLMFVLLVLIVSWGLRAFAPVTPLLNLAMLEADAPPAAQPPPDIAPVLRASLVKTVVDGKMLTAELESLQAELQTKVVSCGAIELPRLQRPEPQRFGPQRLPADGWAKKDLSMLKGCWLLGREGRASRRAVEAPAREENCAIKAARLCFDADGHGQTELTAVCPVAGKISCARPVTAAFTNYGTLTMTSPATPCQEGIPTQMVYSVGLCRRVDDDHAMCRRTDFAQTDRPGTRFEEVEFRREPQDRDAPVTNPAPPGASPRDR